MKKLFAIGGLVAASVFSQGASAALITTESGFGGISNFSSCKSASNTTAMVTGNLLTGVPDPLSCIGFFNVDIDTALKTITLTGREVGNYETGFLEITGITEFVLAGLSLSGPNEVIDPLAYGGNMFTAVPNPQISFTGSSLKIVFDAFGGVAPDDQFSYSGTGGQSVFSYVTADSQVPEPESLALVGLGLLGLAAVRRHKMKID